MDTMLTMLKVDLGILSTTAYDERLTQLLDYAQRRITKKGVVINPDELEDAQLCVMYAAWLWRRRDTGEGMPRMLRYTLNNRIVGAVGSGRGRGGDCGLLD